MTPIIARIKSYVLIIDPTIVNDARLDLIIADVVDRALVYMNRAYLVAQYEKDLLDSTVEEEDYVLPLPKELERTLANTIVGVIKNTLARNTATEGAVTSMSDNGQSVSYSTQVANYLATTTDNEVFSGATALLDNYRLAKVIKDGHSTNIQIEY